MTSLYSTASAPVPVAVPISCQFDNGRASIDSPRTSFARSSISKSNYNLPSSRNGNFGPVSEEQIQQLMKQGYTRGLAASLAQTIKAHPLRIWVVDNSGSMQNTDGHRFVETKRTQDVKIVNCSRWDEIRECINYHAQMAATLEAPTTFRLLNAPPLGANSQQFGIAESTLEAEVVQAEVRKAIDIMRSSQPGGSTPLIRHVEEIRQSIEALAPELRANGSRVAIILATDGLPTDDRGYGGKAIQQQFVNALRGLEGLPVWVVVRLCTDEDDVVDFYNDLDGQLELSLEVLDDFVAEAKEVYEQNPWLNYGLPLHRLREMGYHHRIFDMMDERPFTHEEVREFCGLLLNNPELPDPSADWKEFSAYVKGSLKNERGVWNPMKKKVAPWIDMHKLDKKYGNKTCVIM